MGVAAKKGAKKTPAKDAKKADDKKPAPKKRRMQKVEPPKVSAHVTVSKNGVDMKEWDNSSTGLPVTGTQFAGLPGQGELSSNLLKICGAALLLVYNLLM